MYTKLMMRLRRYVIELVILGILLIFLSWLVGYYANALFGLKFQLESCWAGIAALGSAGVLAFLKYVVDSSPWNTSNGVIPHECEEVNDNAQTGNSCCKGDAG